MTDYTALAKSRIRKPGGKRKPRLLIYGRNKKGKTHFCATAPNVLILDPEDGTDQEHKTGAHVWDIQKWEDINDAYQFLRGGKHPYEWVAIDAGSRVYGLALRWIKRQKESSSLDSRPNKVTQPEFGQANQMFNEMLMQFHSLRNVGVIITCPERMEIIEELEEYEQDEDAKPAGYTYVPDLPKGARSSVSGIVDVIGRIYVVRGTFSKKFKTKEGKTVTKEVENSLQRRLWVSPHDMYDTGYRSGYVLPDFISEPTVPRVVEFLRNGRVKQNGS